MNYKFKNIFAICIGILPLYIVIIWYRLIQTKVFTTFDMLIYPLLLGGGNILLILVLNKYLLKRNISDFNFGKGNWYKDIFAGFVLTIIYFIFLFIERGLFTTLLSSGHPPSQETINLMINLTRNPILLTIWLGPVVWIGVALYEELSRTFFLNCLWALVESRFWQIISIFIVSIIIGILHLYQGTFGIVSISLQGLVVGYYYYKYRRLLPLIISHALYDSIQIIIFVFQVSH